MDQSEEPLVSEQLLPERLHIKEEPEMLSEGQEGNQLCRQQETNSAACPVKCEDEEEKPQASQLHWRQQTHINMKEEPSSCTLDEFMKIESVGINSEEPEAARNPDPSSLVLQGPEETDDPDTQSVRQLRTSRKMSNWRFAEIRELLAITAEKSIHDQITGTVKDGALYEKVAEELNRRGFNRDKKQVIRKMKILRKKFNDHRSSSGTSDWEHFEVCQAIWGSNHTANPQYVQASVDNTPDDSPTPNTPETADEERDDAAESLSESTPEQVPPPAKRRKTITKAQVAAEGIKELLVKMDRQDAEKEKARLQKEERRWAEEKAMWEAERRERAEQFSSLSGLFMDVHREMQNEFALLRETMGRMTPVVPQHSSPHHHRPPVSRYSDTPPPPPPRPSFNEDPHSSPYL